VEILKKLVAGAAPAPIGAAAPDGPYRKAG
jgi:hypothetical protein